MGVKLGLPVRENFTLRMFESRVLRGIFTLTRNEIRENGASCTVRSFIIYTLPQVLGRSGQVG
jgi:hypothetical protein